MIDTKELRRLAQAVTPEEVSELLERLEAAEKERDNLRFEVKVREAERKRIVKDAEALRAKIEAMEQQEPVAWIRGRDDHRRRKLSFEKPVKSSPDKLHWSPLYALPGAQNVPEKLCYDSRWEISIDYVDGWNAAVDMMRGKSPSWHCPDCCIAFPFGAPKSCPHDDARCNSLLAAAPEAKRDAP